jgi:hypothetical protein
MLFENFTIQMCGFTILVITILMFSAGARYGSSRSGESHGNHVLIPDKDWPTKVSTILISSIIKKLKRL